MLSHILQNPPLQKRILITLVGLTVYEIGSHIPLAGVDYRLLYEYSTVPGSTVATYDMLTGGVLSRAVVFSLGITPYLTGAIIILLLSGFIPYLRRLREGPVEANGKFDSFIYGTTAVVALLQSYGVAIFLEGISLSSGQPIVSDFGWGFRLMVMLTITSGTMLLVWIADQITHRGIANGVALIFLFDLIKPLPSALLDELQALFTGNQMILNEALALALFAGLTGASILMLNAKRCIPLKFAGRNPPGSDGKNQASNIMLRLNTVGIIPVLSAQIFLLLISNVFSPESLPYWVFYCGLIILLTYLWTAITFSAKDLVNCIKQYGFAMLNMDSEKESANYLDEVIQAIIFPYAIFLMLMVLTPLVMVKWLGINTQLSYFFGPNLLVICAVCIAAIENIRMEQEKWDNDQQGSVEVERVPVFAGETELEVSMVREILHQAGIESIKYSNRVISEAGTFAIWEAARPAFPSLTIHRRLGQGRVVAQVDADQADEARRILLAHNIVSK